MSYHVCSNCKKVDIFMGAVSGETYPKGYPALTKMEMVNGEMFTNSKKRFDSSDYDEKSRLAASLHDKLINSSLKELALDKDGVKRSFLYLCRNCNLGEDHKLVEATEREAGIARVSLSNACTNYDQNPYTLTQDDASDDKTLRIKTYKEIQIDYSRNNGFQGHSPKYRKILLEHAALVLGYKLNTDMRKSHTYQSPEETTVIKFIANLKRILKVAKRNRNTIKSGKELVNVDGTEVEPSKIISAALVAEIKATNGSDIISEIEKLITEAKEGGAEVIDKFEKRLLSAMVITPESVAELEAVAPGSTKGIKLYGGEEDEAPKTDGPVNEITVDVLPE